MNAGIIELERLRRELSPRLAPGELACCCLPHGRREDLAQLEPLGFLEEDEGLTVLLRREDADAAKLDYSVVLRRIVLGVHSALEAVGLTAAISTELAKAGCSANIWAGFHHDHVLVPVAQASRALDVLRRWQAGGSSSGVVSG